MTIRMLLMGFLFSFVACSPTPLTLQRGSEEVTIPREEISLAGTFEIPGGEGPVPAVLMVQGSAAFDRNYGFFDELAARLADSGIASLRIDDRGVGGSGGVKHDLSAADLAQDVLAAFEYLVSRPETHPGMVGLMGHSFGGALVPSVARQSGDVAFLITLAGYAVTGEALMMDGRRLSEESQGREQGELARVLALQQAIFEASKTDGPWETVEAEHRALRRAEFDRMSPEARERFDGFESFVQRSYDEAVLGLAKTPWFKSFLSLDPREEISGLEVPFLAVFGESDTSVPPSQNLEPMEAALSNNSEGTIVVIPGVGHFFRDSGEISEQLLSTVVNWVLEDVALDGST